VARKSLDKTECVTTPVVAHKQFTRESVYGYNGSVIITAIKLYLGCLTEDNLSSEYI